MKKVASTLAVVLFAAAVHAAPAPDSRRLALAKDYIADEQWNRAIAELRIVADDPRDANRDEALFWLAHSQSQIGEQAEALQTIARLERQFLKSRWVRPARSLRVEIAQRLRRDDVLWVLAAPPAAPPPAVPVPAARPAPPAPRAAMPPPRAAAPTAVLPPQPAPPPDAPAAVTPAVPPAPAPFPAATPPPPRPGRPGAPPAPFEGFLPPQPYEWDSDVRMQALVSLLDSHSDRVIPLLREIALDNKNPNDARRAVIVLAQSPRSDARNTLVEAARRGAPVVRLAAIREMGRVQEPVFTTALVNIVRSESDASLRDTAIVTLGRTGARVQLRSLYAQLPQASRLAVLTGLFNAKDDDELIRIATSERDQRLRTRARQHLRLLATPKAVKFLTENP
ncbi:MAG TPA: HEAT repeat domain-containing protein [Vicinamibacterales bacterium]|nr:HEAT repeat domain-containing protein [Vicinamibacterales bacterium]